MTDSPLVLSIQILSGVRDHKDVDDLLVALGNYDRTRLESCLNNDTNKLTFWINLYNASYILLSEKYDNPKPFKLKCIEVAKERVSLDDIEHSILRKSRWKYGLGIIPKFFDKKLIKDWSVYQVDYRIHFALNCGAASCPPIRFYTSDRLYAQLDLATQSYLEQEVQIRATRINLSSLILFYIADFGWKKGILEMLVKYDYIPNRTRYYSLKWNKYDWTVKSRNFSN